MSRPSTPGTPSARPRRCRRRYPPSACRPAHLEPGLYRTITGNEATAWGLVAAAGSPGLQLVLRQLSDHAGLRHPARARRAQALRRDDLPGRGRDRRDRGRDRRFLRGLPWASPRARARARPQERGHGPGHRGRAPLVIINVQRAGPSTGLPTKTEQSDLYRRSTAATADAPLAVLAAASSADCFEVAIEAVPDRDQVHDAGDRAHRRLSRQRGRALDDPGFLGLQALPRRLPQRARGLPSLPARSHHARAALGQAGHAGLEHRIGGIEKRLTTAATSPTTPTTISA